MAGTFSQQLEELLNPLPKFADPEDDGDEETRAKVTEGLLEEDHHEEDALSLSSLRKRNSLPEDTDTRYRGKAVTREQLLMELEANVEDDGEDDDDDDDDDDVGEEDATGEPEDDEIVSSMDDDDDDDDDDKGDQMPEDKHRLSSKKTVRFAPSEVDYHKLTEGMDDLGVSEEDESDEEAEGSDDEDDEEDDDDDDDGEEGAMATFSQQKVDEEVEKGKAVKNQLALWDQLLEGRIKIQKALMTANQLPQPQTLPEFKRRGEAELAGALKTNHKALKGLQRSLMELHEQLLHKNPETRSVLMSDDALSDDDDEGERRTVKRKLDMAEYPDLAAKRFAAFQPYRDATLQKWHDKTRLNMGKSSKTFGAFERNILTQVKHVLMDKERLIRRTQTRRSEYRVLGKLEKPTVAEDPVCDEGKEAELQLKSNAHLKDLDEDIFDDDDFYHQLLRELIERRTSATDPNSQVAMGRQWLAIQKLRSKIKKKVDTKASKGRKVRFHIHSKLVNFMAPIDHSAVSDEARSELYRGLFGQSVVRE